MLDRMNRVALACSAVAVFALSVSADRTATAQIGTIHMPVYDDAIMNCVDPDIIQAHLITDILSDQLQNAQLQLAMHLANRAEALRRAGSNTAYIEQMDEAIAEDRARLSFLTENLTCWRDRLADLIAEQDGDEELEDQVTTRRNPPSAPTFGDIEMTPELFRELYPELAAALDEVAAAPPIHPFAGPGVNRYLLDEADRIMAQMIAATTEFESTISDLDRSLDEGQMVERCDGPCPDVEIGPTGGPTTDHGSAADNDQAAIQAREAAADRLIRGALVLVRAGTIHWAREYFDLGRK